MFIVCLSLFCQFSTQSENNLIILSLCKCEFFFCSIHDYNSNDIYIYEGYG